MTVLGAARGYEEILMGYTARSRQQSMDRRPDREEDRKKIPSGRPQSEHHRRSRKPNQDAPMVKIEPAVVELEDSLRKPPTVPRRKREK